MTFLAPFFLGLAAFIGVPLLVHLLRRRVTRRVEFPAVRYLLQTEREHSRERAVRNRLLLILRLIAVIALVGAAARPMARLGGAGHPPIAVAIVLDQSMSTRAVINGRTIFSALQGEALNVVSGLASDDRAWLITSSGRVVAGDASALTNAIAALEPSAGRGDLSGALRRARTLVDAGAPRTQVIVVLTDGQHSALDSIEQIDDVPIVVHAPDITVPANRVVHDVQVEPSRWVPSGRVKITLSGPDSLNWRVLLGSRTVARGVAAASPFDSPIVIEASALAGDTGWIAGRVEVDADDFPGDDSRAFAVLAGSPPAVSVERSAGPFIDAAVEALVADGRLTRSTGAASAASASSGTVRILSATGDASGSALRTAPEDPLQVVMANRSLERAGVPWKFGAVMRDTVQISESLGVSSGSATIAGAEVTLRYRLERVPSPGAADTGVTLAVAGGAPWLVAGKGYVLIASPLTVAATSVPLQAAFVPWLREIITQRLGDGGDLVYAAPDDTISVSIDADSLAAPDGTMQAIVRERLIVPPSPGVYLFRRGSRSVGALVVNPEIEESEVSAWGGSIWQSMVTGTTVQLEPNSGSVASAVFDRSGGRPLAWPLVLVAVVALLLEALIARGMLVPRSTVTAAA